MTRKTMESNCSEVNVMWDRECLECGAGYKRAHKQSCSRSKKFHEQYPKPVKKVKKVKEQWGWFDKDETYPDVIGPFSTKEEAIKNIGDIKSNSNFYVGVLQQLPLDFILNSLQDPIAKPEDLFDNIDRLDFSDPLPRLAASSLVFLFKQPKEAQARLNKILISFLRKNATSDVLYIDPEDPRTERVCSCSCHKK